MRLLAILLLFASLPANAGAEEPLAGRADRPRVDFASQIAPLLKGRCLGCHGAKHQRGALRLDSRERLMAGGEGGVVVIAGDAARSRLVELIEGASDGQVMPPEGTRLTPSQVEAVRAWIDDGALWPATVRLDVTPAELARNHWSFQPIRPPAHAGPNFVAQPAARNAIDLTVARHLRDEGLAPSPAADQRTLVRRVTFDLLGLPPSADELALRTADDRPDAHERLVDSLLASPHYGERWARPWLDLCHYGDSDGYLTDQLRPVAWRYRQWLIEALNADLPYDQFTVLQLAGDLLPNPTTEQRLATGFLRNTLSNREGGADLEEYRVEQIVDRVAMVGTAWLGLTVGCARCHDHKFDPLSQREYYELYAFLDSADEVNIDAPLEGELAPYAEQKAEHDRRRAELIAPVVEGLDALRRRWELRLLEAAAHPGQDATWDRQWEVLGLIWGGNLGEGQLEGCQIVMLDPARRTADQQDRITDYFLSHGSLIDPAKFTELKLADLAGQLRKLREALPRLTRAPTMRKSPHPRPVYVHLRGDFRTAGEPVTAATPAWLPPGAMDSPRDRLGLARWLVSESQPLTRRVAVNRAWQEFFGRGLFVTSENLGLQGDVPRHAELLDWLALELSHRGWSTKALHRVIVESATYRQSSRVDAALARRDPLNQSLARQSSLRLSSEQVRDATLAVAGLLDRRLGGPSVFPPQPETVAMEGFENKWIPSAGGDRYRRGIYTFVQRLSPFAQNVTFDAPGTSRICTRRERSNSPLQALTLLNDEAFFEAARSLGRRLAGDPRDASERIAWAFEQCASREPTAEERRRLVAFLQEQRGIFARDGEAARQVSAGREGVERVDELAAWTMLGSVLLNLHEFITRD